jgi:hypothetical protein
LTEKVFESQRDCIECLPGYWGGIQQHLF